MEWGGFVTIIMKKYHGLGNDYLVLDPNKNSIKLDKENIKLICHRNLGAGSDGILYGPILENRKIKVKIYNPDGSEAEKSGNGVRIFSKYLLDEGYVTGKSFLLSTLGGDVKVEYIEKNGCIVKVDMGKVTFLSNEIPVKGEKREVLNEHMSFNDKEYNVGCCNEALFDCVEHADDTHRIGSYRVVRARQNNISACRLVEYPVKFTGRYYPCGQCTQTNHYKDNDIGVRRLKASLCVFHKLKNLSFLNPKSVHSKVTQTRIV